MTHPNSNFHSLALELELVMVSAQAEEDHPDTKCHRSSQHIDLHWLHKRRQHGNQRLHRMKTHPNSNLRFQQVMVKGPAVALEESELVELA